MTLEKLALKIPDYKVGTFFLVCVLVTFASVFKMLQDAKVNNKTEKQPEKEKGASGDGDQEVRIFVWL